MKKCKNADKYKAIRPPKCGCDVCIAKWAAAQKERSKITNLLKDRPFNIKIY